jgi:hypothetical protein
MRPLACIAALLLALPAAHAEVRTWNFRVLLEGRDIGQHQFTVHATGEAREVVSGARFDVRVLSLPAYRYQHEARELWKGDCLHSIASRTDANGKRRSVDAVTRNGRLVVVRPEGSEEHHDCVMSFAYWNPRILEARHLLNGQTGELTPVTVEPRGEETIEVRGRPALARRHRISAPGLQIDLWYADAQWVALEAPAAGGRRLRYALM